MEEAHRIHKDVAWGWTSLVGRFLRNVRAEIAAALPPRGRVVTPWSLRAHDDWTA